MTASGLSAASFHASGAHASQSPAQHKHGHHSPSISDVDAAGSSVASAPSATGKVGSKVNITA